MLNSPGMCRVHALSFYEVVTRPSEDGERLEGRLQFGTIVFLGEGAEDDQSDGVDDALLAQDRRGSGVPRRCLNDLH